MAKTSKSGKYDVDYSDVKAMLASLTINMKKPWNNKIIQSTIKYCQSRIDTGKDINNKPFTALALRTIQAKGHDRPLQDTLAMRNGFTFTVSGNTLKIGNEMPYAKKHQFGDPLNKIPQRTFMGPPPDLAEQILAELMGDVNARKMD